MLKSLVVFLRFFLFWLLFFFLDRIIFIIYFWDKLGKQGLYNILSVFGYAFRLDASMVAYISAIPVLIYLIFLFLAKISLPKEIGKIYVLTLIAIFSLISVFNLNLYREWGSKINYRALDLAFNSPNEAIASASSSPILLSLIILIGLLLCSIVISNKVIDYRMYDKEKPAYYKIGSAVAAIILVVLLARGGLQLSPINQSMSYFSTEPILNHAAVNTEWNLLQDILNNKYGSENPYQYYSREEADSIVAELFKKPDTATVSVLKTSRPNIVVIIVESLTAQVVGSLGGEKGVTPNLDSLSETGILFEQIYAAAGRTDKGVVATLSGFPAQAVRSIMKENGRQEKLPGIARELETAGYHTLFYYGGESEFFNMKSYILSHGYQNLIDQHSFLKKDMNSKWGTYDGKVFDKNLNDLDTVKEPFFSTILTLTNHEPFELPKEPHFKGDKVENKFRSTAYYTDSCIGAYLREAKKKPWYKNTLFIILADHSHRLPGDAAEYEPKRYHIPLLFLGEVIRDEFRGKRMKGIGSQTDLPSTLLNQLGLNAGKFIWSKDLFNPKTPEFAFFNWDNGFGFASEAQIISFDNVGKNIIYRKNPPDPNIDSLQLRYGKAYMQKVFQDYLDM